MGAATATQAVRPSEVSDIHWSLGVSWRSTASLRFAIASPFRFRAGKGALPRIAVAVGRGCLLRRHARPSQLASYGCFARFSLRGNTSQLLICLENGCLQGLHPERRSRS